MATGQTADLEAALSRVIRLADEHATALDSPMRCMAASAWVGGGAPAFSKALNEQRTVMQRAFQEAATQIAARLRQLGGQAPRVPSISTSVSVMTAARTGFSGMDIAAMEGLVASLQKAGQELPEAGHRLSAELSALCVPASSGKQIAGAGEWAQGQVGDLRRRLSVIQQEHDSGLTTKAMAGFGLFGGYAPDPGGVDKLTAAAGNGDAAALKALVALQNTGKDATLANRLNAWWHQLGKPAQERLMNQSPQLIGTLNGLPTTARDQANRNYLRGEKIWLGSELARLRALPSSDEVRKAIGEAEAKMRQLASVERSLAQGGRNGLPPAYLMQVELGGLGKTVISFGDPDKADRIVAYVPDTGTTLEKFDGDVQRASDMWAQANFLAPGTKVASIAWLGYAAPQWGNAGPAHTPGTLDDALAGAPALASFADGLHAAHRAASDARFTVLGHSYGSTVTGVAAQMRPKSFADQLIFVGSPGVVAMHAKALGVDSVWVGEAPNDPVGDIGSFGPLQPVTPDAQGVVKELAKDIWKGFVKGEGPFGADPSRSEFGAKRFYVPDSGDSIASFAGHSSYWGDNERGWDRRSISLRNIGYLINGQYDELVPFPESPDNPAPPRPTAPPSLAAEPKSAEEPTFHQIPSPRPAGG
ncbi:alpha/beta hydrolase [Sphaerisporangium rhizosphaerae]|uniref:Alpha/beta hydrolase n=1 Tax=Sphaerisporangium rhizosphaerae TaxID=2269375 RepID=A0ABW2PJC4_9ACTN